MPDLRCKEIFRLKQFERERVRKILGFSWSVEKFANATLQRDVGLDKK